MSENHADLSGEKHPNYGKQFSDKTRKKMSEARKGKKNPRWKGGKSFEPYCPKFTLEFKERVREFWGRKCGISGITEEENGKKLAIHHVNYEKMSCCNDTPPLFIALSNSSHSKTNSNRKYWEHILTEYIMIYFDGNSYLLI